MARSPQSEGEFGSDADDVSAGMDAAANDLAALRRDISKLSETVAALVSSQAEYARSSVTDAASGVYDSGLEALEYAEERARGAVDDLGSTIERNPFTSVIAALGVGLILGMMNRGR